MEYVIDNKVWYQRLISQHRQTETNRVNSNTNPGHVLVYLCTAVIRYVSLEYESQVRGKKKEGSQMHTCTNASLVANTFIRVTEPVWMYGTFPWPVIRDLHIISAHNTVGLMLLHVPVPYPQGLLRKIVMQDPKALFMVKVPVGMSMKCLNLWSHANLSKGVYKKETFEITTVLVDTSLADRHKCTVTVILEVEMCLVILIRNRLSW
jgi:hypothetical protein